jgi:putative oxidoreductase
MSSFDFALFSVRLVAGIIFTAHGAQKLFGAFDGPGLSAMAALLGPVGYLVSIGEFFGGLGLLAGILTRFSAASLIVIMVGAIFRVHLAYGFFLGDRPGFEYNFALIGLLMPVLLCGPGRIAVARVFSAPVRQRWLIE